MQFHFSDKSRITGSGRPRSGNRRHKSKNRPIGFLIVAAAIVLVPFVSFLFTTNASSTKKVQRASAEPSQVTAPTDPATVGGKPESVTTVEVNVRRNDTFYTILDSLGVPAEEIVRIAGEAGGIYDLGRVAEGDRVRVTKVDGALERVEYLYDDLEGIVIERDDEVEGGFRAERFEVPYRIEEAAVTATIENSLYEAGIKSGAPPKVIMELSDIFAWDVDFSTDMRKGDTFSVLYETMVVDGEPVRVGKILGAEVVNAGERYVAIYYRDGSGQAGYYDLNGRSLKRTLLKSPLRYRRISSYFTNRRYHPILKRYRPHHGIDYAAPKGTPVEASGDGRVVFAGWKRGYGNFIVIRHNSIYTTAYGHLSRIKKGIKKGRRVAQGEVIGYVGSTGISTGPHLHYEVKVRGRLVNPLSIKSSPRRSLSGEELEAFLAVQKDVLAKLSTGTTLVAFNRSVPEKDERAAQP